ncbi:MAG TPA: MFS transporter [Kiritimatiellia bacterium]|nr:MFS transporter [Kiritimatiellia bacterium]HRZ10986.1 MFS transporter [Kiritimatiellia bacterium]HSA18559.1 MFS transporter [Kiritimatiellia bacterium]
MKKALNLGAALAVLVCLGGIFAWSEFVPALRKAYGYTAAQTQWIFGLTIASFTTSMIGAGRLLYRWGPARVAATGGLLFAAGYLVGAFTCDRFAGLLAGLGLLAGCGIGFGYVAPLATVMAWSPGRRGLAGGIAVAGFGSGAILLASLAAAGWRHGLEVSRLFGIIGLSYGAVILLAAAGLSRPPDSVVSAGAGRARPWKDARLRRLFLGMFCGTFAGLIMVGNLKPIALSGGIAAGAATASISILAGAVLLLLPARASGPLFGLGAGLIGLGFGACFVVYAAEVAAHYGAGQVGGVYPLVFLAYGLAGLTGPALGGWLFDVSGTYRYSMLLAAAVAASGAALARMPAGRGAPTAPAFPSCHRPLFFTDSSIADRTKGT